MGFLTENCRLALLTNEILSQSEPFSCGDDDLDNFFREDAVLFTQNMLGRTYCYLLRDNPKVIVCAFTVSNESMRTDLLPGSRRKALNRAIPREKQMRRYPATLIGRLGVNKYYSDKGIGQELVELLSLFFTNGDYFTACRYIAVDAYNNPRTLNFYKNKCGFHFLFSTEEQEAENSKLTLPLKTRYMYLDLMDKKE
ncbi:MAG: N-acetyltransferase [Prevotella sp.]|nr:N-acetyltransferase [Prevotella sp.]